MKFVFVFRVR